MARKAKAGARFNYPARPFSDSNSAKLCVTFNGKRIAHNYNSKAYALRCLSGVDLNLFNSEGELVNADAVPAHLMERQATASNLLRLIRETAIFMANEADRRGLWSSISSKHFFALVDAALYEAPADVIEEMWNKAKEGAEQ